MLNTRRKTSAQYPPPCRLARALELVGDLLGTGECFYYAGSFHFRRAGGWSIVISPESAGRFRLSACLLSQPRATLWSLDGEDDHLAGVVLELAALTRNCDERLDSIAHTHT